MKKILVLLSMILMLTNVSTISQLFALDILPFVPVHVTKIEGRVVVDGTEYTVIEVDGQVFYVKVQS